MRRVSLAGVVTAVVMSLVTFLAAPVAAIPPDAEELLVPGETLLPGEDAVSPNTQYRLVMQTDGNVVFYGLTFPRWSSGTFVPGTTLTMQNDGNLVAYSPTGVPVWSTNTWRPAPAGIFAAVQNDGNFVLYANDGAQVIKQTGPDATMLPGRVIGPGGILPSSNGRYALAMQTDGNLVIYARPGGPIFATNTTPDNSRLVMQADGNLVVYSPAGIPQWSTGVAGPNARAVMQDDGNLVVYRANGTVAFATKK